MVNNGNNSTKAVFNIYFRENKKNTIFYNDSYFNLHYKSDWLQDNFAKRVIKEIDKGVVLGEGAVKTEEYGIISPSLLSTGVKTLLLLKYDKNGYIFNGSKMGNNCVKFLLEIAREKPVNIMLFHILDLKNIDNIEYNFVESGITITDSKKYPELVLELIEEALLEVN